ncbi:MAG: DUF3276 family protein [Bacteroidia bacterium]
MEENGNNQELYSKAIKAGKRTYFFDVKSTRADQYYLTLTESKKRFTEDGKFTYEKHKIFLYREDFEKFMEALKDSIQFIEDNSGPLEPRKEWNPDAARDNNGEYSANVSFEDLDK